MSLWKTCAAHRGSEKSAQVGTKGVSAWKGSSCLGSPRTLSGLVCVPRQHLGHSSVSGIHMCCLRNDETLSDVATFGGRVTSEKSA